MGYSNEKNGRVVPCMKKNLLKIALLALCIVPCVYGFYHYDLHMYLTDEEKAKQLIIFFGPLSVLVFILLQAVQVIIAPIPGDVTGLIGGYFFGSVLGTIYSTIGLTAGSWLAFYLGRLYGLPLAEKIIRPETIQKYDYFMEHKGIAVSFALFLIPGFPKDALCYLMGMSHIRTSVFLCISTAGRLFGTILLSVAGSSVSHHHNGTFFIAAGAIAVTALLAYLYRGKLHDMLKKRHGS
jgi:uncharacterized membrane protein YdjX (TVP38/TMEM64 family)